jgi:hypothetical protein
MKTVTLTFKITILASQRDVFDYVSDWERQSDWIMFTTVKRLSDATSQDDVNLLAITKFGPIKLVDTMVVTDWHPYDRINIEHTGRLVLGRGVFSVKEISKNTCEFIWQEITPVPFGLIGRAGLAIFMPLFRMPFDRSLKKLKFNIEQSPSVK